MSQEDRIVETVKASNTSVKAIPLNLKVLPASVHASEKDKEKALEENTIGEWCDDSVKPIGDGAA